MVVKSDSDQVTVVAGGITLYHSMMAAETLKAAGINIRVVDVFTVKPIDQETLVSCARATGGRVLTVEDHYPEGTVALCLKVHANLKCMHRLTLPCFSGGIGEAVSGALSGETGVTVQRLAVQVMPRSGKPDELLEMFGIDSKAIVKQVKLMLGR